MGEVFSKEQNIHNEGATLGIQTIIQGDYARVNNYYTETKEPELEDFNFPKPIDSFKGREDEFKQLDDHLFQDDKKMVIIWGLPGFGKTELVKQFAQKCKLNSKIKYICWLQASNKDILKDSLKTLIKMLKLPEVDELRVLLQIVRNRYQNSETLFVFDDVDNKSPWSLLDWETPRGCWTLVNSQFGEWGTMPSVQLGPLDSEAAVALLQHQQDPAVTSNPSLWYTLAALLDHTPIALHLASAYIRQEMKLFPKKFNLFKYIQKLRKSREKFVDEQLPVQSFLPYQYSIQVAMKFSIEKIIDLNKFESNLALDIINIAAYLNQYYILEKTLLKFSFIQNKLKEEEDEEPEDEVRRALYVLESYAFVSLDGGYVRIHGLVQESILFYHNKPNVNIEAYYISCLEYVLNNKFNWHSETILKQADKKLEIFKKFYDEYKSKIISVNKTINSNILLAKENIKDPALLLFLEINECLNFDDVKNKITDEELNSIKNITSLSFLQVLFVAEAKECIIHIFDDLGSQTKQAISEHRLFFSAIDSQQPNMIKLLLEYGEDLINKTTEAGSPLLHYTVGLLNLDILNPILEYNNTDVNVRDNDGATCVSFAILSSFVMPLNTMNMTCQVIRALVARGASVYNVNNEGCSLLHVAVRWIRAAKDLKVVRFIMDELQVNVDTLNNNSMTALHVIIYRRAMMKIGDELMGKVINLLMRHGASVHVKCINKITPLDLIKKYEFHFLVPILEYYGVYTGL